jgi:hypothetical protein
VIKIGSVVNQMCHGQDVIIPQLHVSFVYTTIYYNNCADRHECVTVEYKYTTGMLQHKI